MDDDDADYMQGSEDEVDILAQWLGLRSQLDQRTMALITLMATRLTIAGPRIWRTCTTLQNVSPFLAVFNCRDLKSRAALKEDNPEEALAAFKRIVTTEEKQGDW